MQRTYSTLFCLFMLLLLSACSDSDDAVEQQAIMDVYGNKFPLGDVRLWINPAQISNEKTDFVYKDSYTDKEGNPVTNNVNGFFINDKTVTTGSFILTFYESGLVFNETMKKYSGVGAVLSLHITSSNPNMLDEGTYTCSSSKEINTFEAYVSSEYNPNNALTPQPASITEGTLTVERNGDLYTLVFDGKISAGAPIHIEYQGDLKTTQVERLAMMDLEGIQLDGLLDKVSSDMYFYASYIGSETGIDKQNGKAFFSTIKGITKSASENGRETIDLALHFDESTQTFTFESPISMRRFLDHKDPYLFPCHTEYMMAPADFSEEDFENFTAFDFDFHPEIVSIPMADFSPCYVFFKAGTGVKGVIKVKGIYPGGEEKIIYHSPIRYIFKSNPSLYIDLKSPASYIDNKIK